MLFFVRQPLFFAFWSGLRLFSGKYFTGFSVGKHCERVPVAVGQSDIIIAFIVFVEKSYVDFCAKNVPVGQLVERIGFFGRYFFRRSDKESVVSLLTLSV